MFARLCIACLTIIITGCATMETAQHPSNKEVIAHRGASGYLPEHTLEAAAMAYGLGADFIEPDVVLTKDGIPVVLHDIILDPTTNVEDQYPERQRTNGHWYAIDFTLAEIKSLRVHERVGHTNREAVYPNRFPVSLGSFNIPTLAEEIELVQGLNQSTGRNVGIYPEMKSPKFHTEAGLDIGQAIFDVLNQYGYTKTDGQPAYVQCFDASYLKDFRQRFGANLKTIQLIGPNEWKESDTDYHALMQPEGLDDVARYADGIGLWIYQLKDDAEHTPSYVINPNIVSDAHHRGLLVHAYTLRKDELPSYVSSFNELQEWLFYEQNVDGAFTDFTQETVHFLNKKG